MNERYSAVRVILLVIWICTPITINIQYVFSAESTPQLPNTQTDADATDVVIPAARVGLETSSRVAKLRRPNLRPARAVSKPIGPDALETAPSDSNQGAEENAQRSALIPTVWAQTPQLIPTEIDAEYRPIQRIGGIPVIQPRKAITPHGKPLLSVKSAIHAKSKAATPTVLPEQLRGPGYDTMFFPIVPVKSGLGIATFPKKGSHPSNSLPAVAPNNDPVLIREETLNALRTKGYRTKVAPPAKKPVEVVPVPVVKAKFASDTKPVELNPKTNSKPKR